MERAVLQAMVMLREKSPDGGELFEGKEGGREGRAVGREEGKNNTTPYLSIFDLRRISIVSD